jgi:hypothetical protein
MLLLLFSIIFMSSKTLIPFIFCFFLYIIDQDVYLLLAGSFFFF